MFGVRVLHFDEKRRLLFAGGFSPYLEIYRGEDFALLGRLKTPPWIRGITTAAERSIAFVTTSSGLVEIQLPSWIAGSIVGRLERWDPFFMLFRVAAFPVAQRAQGKWLSTHTLPEVRKIHPELEYPSVHRSD